MTTIYLASPTRETVVHGGVKDQNPIKFRASPAEYMDGLLDMYHRCGPIIKQSPSRNFLTHAHYGRYTISCDIVLDEEIPTLRSIFECARALGHGPFKSSLFGIAVPLGDGIYRRLREELQEKREPRLLRLPISYGYNVLEHRFVSHTIADQVDLAMEIHLRDNTSSHLTKEPLILMAISSSNGQSPYVDDYYIPDPHILICRKAFVRWTVQ